MPSECQGTVDGRTVATPCSTFALAAQVARVLADDVVVDTREPGSSDAGESDDLARRAEVLLRGDRDDRESITVAATLLEESLGLGGRQTSPGALDEVLVLAGGLDDVCSWLPQRRRVARVSNLGLAYRLLGSLDPNPSLRDAAIAARRLAVRLAAGDDDRVRLCAVSLAQDLRVRFELHGSAADLDEAVVLCREVAGLDEELAARDASGKEPDVPAGNAMATLCTLLRLRYESTSDEPSLSDAIRIGRRAVSLAPRGTNAWYSRNNNLSLALHDRWLLRRALADVDEAVESASLAVDERREQTSADAAGWGTLGAALRSRFILRVGLDVFHPLDPSDLRIVRPAPDISREDIDRAVNAFARAVDLSGATSRDVRRSRLVAALLTRYDMFRDRVDLEDAVSTARRVDVGMSAEPLVLNHVAYALARAGVDFRLAALVVEAIDLGQRALSGLVGGANEAMALENLGTYYRALELLETPHLVSSGDGTPELSSASPSASVRDPVKEGPEPSESYREVWLRAAENPQSPAWYRLSAAKRWAEASYAGLPEDPTALHAYDLALDLVTSVATVGIDRRSREAQLRDLSVVARDGVAAALTAGRAHDALAALERGRAVLWSESVASQRLVLALADADPILASRVADVGDKLWRPRGDHDLAAATDFSLSLAGNFTTDRGPTPAVTATALPTGARRALPQVVGPETPVADRAGAVSPLSEVEARDAGQQSTRHAKIRLVASHDGTEVAETSPTRPPLAANDTPGAPTSWAAMAEPDPVDRRLALAREWDDLLAEVRSLPGFETFLRPPSYEDLLEAATDGPVVTVNVSVWRCDALVLTPDGVEAVPLPDLTLRDAERRLEHHLESLSSFDLAVADFEETDRAFQRDVSDGAAMRARQEAGARRREAAAVLDLELTGLVGWMWDVVVVPLLDRLPAPGPDGLRPRVWWCPTGPLALLPLHAAGRGSAWLHDRVVSSTTPTVRSLLDARTDHGSRNRPRPADDTSSVARTGAGHPGDSISPGRTPCGNGSDSRRRFLVASTFASTQSLLAGPLSRLTATDVIECSDLAGVQDHLEHCDFVHFDCHGDQVLADPSQGGVRLRDGVLRIFDLASVAATGEFAGLAACKTAVGGVDLLDEAITLSAALHYAGFRHVVGTLWNLAEHVARDAFSDMYGQLVTSGGAFDPAQSARALAEAVDRLRAEGASLHSWAALIHIGP